MDIQNVRMNMGNASMLVSGLYMAVFGNYPQKNLIFYTILGQNQLFWALKPKITVFDDQHST